MSKEKGFEDLRLALEQAINEITWYELEDFEIKLEDKLIVNLKQHIEKILDKLPSYPSI